MPAFKSKAIKTELYRKAVHLSSLWMPLFIFTAPRNWSILLFFTLLAANLFVEYAELLLQGENAANGGK